MEKTIKIKELNIEVEIKIHDKNKSYSDIKIPKGWRLLRIDEMIFLYNNHKKELNLTDTWEFIEQPFKDYKNKFASRFYAFPGDAYFDCDGEPRYSYLLLGVRFCKDLEGKN